MNPVTALDYAVQALTMLPQVIAGVTNLVDVAQAVAQHVTATTEALKLMQAENRGPTDEEWQAQNDAISKLRNELHN